MNKQTIEFKHSQIPNIYLGVTQKGNTVNYKYVPEENLIFYSPAENDKISVEIKDKETNRYVPKPTPSLLTLECSFEIKNEMLDLLESSKIVRVMQAKNNCEDGAKRIIIAVLPLFSYEKLHVIIDDMCEKYKL